MRRILTLVAACVLTALPASTPASAAVSFGPAVPVISSPCGNTADASVGADGGIRGYASCYGGVIWYFEGSGSSWRSAPTPWVGHVLASVQDSNRVWLLHSGDRGVRLGRRLPGATPVYDLDTQLAPPAQFMTDGDLVVQNGAWWAVWTEDAHNSPEERLYQAKTLGGAVGRQPILDQGNPDYDSSPSLVVRADGRAVLMWESLGPGRPPAVRVATSRLPGPGTWSRSKLVLAGVKVDQALVGNRSVAAWQVGWAPDGAQIVFGDGVAPKLRARHRFARPGEEARVAAAGARTAVAWSSYVRNLPDHPTEAVVATRTTASAWTETVLEPGRVAEVLVAGGKAVVLFSENKVGGRFVARVER